MKYFVHVKDDVVFAWHSSSTEEDIPGDNVHQVEYADDSVLTKKLVNGNFVDAPVIKYAILDEDNDNTVIGIEKTYFLSDAKGPIINNSDVKILWKWNGSEFIAPGFVGEAVQTIQPVDTVEIDGLLVTTSEALPAQSNNVDIPQE